ncbi:MAG: tetratricopeptide repeat protein, partial [Nitrospira sp.]|nr:tetratricopeptide repeat protein [Nitrospira sp.]
MPYPSSFFIAVLCLFVPVFHGCTQASPETQKTKHLERAAGYMEKGQLQEALIEYMNVTKADPDNAEAYYQMALIHLKLGGNTNIQKAFAELRRTLEINKNNRDAQLKISEIYLLGKEPAKAREQADIILASAPDDQEALIIRGRSLINEKRHQDGIAELKKALARDPQQTGIYLEISRAYFFANDRAAAEETLRQGLSAIPKSPDLMLALGDFYLSTGKPNLAETTYKQLTDTAPNDEAAQLRLIDFYRRTNKLAEAESTMQKWASAYPQDERPYIHLGDLYHWIGNRDKALASYRQAETLNAKSLIARDKLTALYLDTGNLGEAEPR